MATYYINADTGNDSTGDGSSGNPWLTLNYAYDNSTTGDTIYLQASTASFTWTIASGYGELRYDRTIEGLGDSPSDHILDAGGIAGHWRFNGTVVLKNLTFTNARISAVFSQDAMFSFTNATDNTSVTVSNCVFHNIQTYGSIGSFGNGLFGRNSTVYIDNNTLTFESCLFYDIYTNSTVTNYRHLIGFQNQRNINLSVTNCTYDHDTISANKLYGLFSNRFSTFASCDIKNNIFYNATGSNLYYYSYGSFTGIDNSYNNLYNITSAPSGTSNITSDPLLIDPPNRNYNLQPDSPCIDTGTLL